MWSGEPEGGGQQGPAALGSTAALPGWWLGWPSLRGNALPSLSCSPHHDPTSCASVPSAFISSQGPVLLEPGRLVSGLGGCSDPARSHLPGAGKVTPQSPPGLLPSILPLLLGPLASALLVGSAASWGIEGMGILGASSWLVFFSVKRKPGAFGKPQSLAGPHCSHVRHVQNSS